MGNEAQKQFVTALNFLLKEEGHGSQAKLARTLKIDPGYLNNIVKGRTPGPQEKKEKIAAYFNLRYENMLFLGRQLLSLFAGDIITNLQSLVSEASALINNPKVQFNFALCHLLNEIDFDNLERLSSKIDIDLESLNSLIHGDACLILSDKRQKQIASEFNLSYEDMLSLGGWILSGKPEKNWHLRNRSDFGKKTRPSPISPEYPPKKSTQDTLCVSDQQATYEFSSRDKKDKNMRLVAEWINQQDEPEEYWTLVKIILKREEPAFREWLKKRSSGGNRGRFPENKSVVGE